MKQGMMMRQLVWMLLLLPILAEASLPEVQAILGSKVVISYQGTRITLEAGETKRGVELLEIRGDTAILRLDGVQRSYRLGERSKMMTDYAAATIPRLRLEVERDGMYRADGHIDGHYIRFLVDTGATVIALNASDARRLGLNYRAEGTKIPVSTASATEMGYRMRLSRVQVGDILLYDVAAVVLDNPAHPSEVLLGNSFLNRINMSREGSSLILEKR